MRSHMLNECFWNVWVHLSCFWYFPFFGVVQNFCWILFNILFHTVLFSDYSGANYCKLYSNKAYNVCSTQWSSRCLCVYAKGILICEAIKNTQALAIQLLPAYTYYHAWYCTHIWNSKKISQYHVEHLWLRLFIDTHALTATRAQTHIAHTLSHTPDCFSRGRIVSLSLSRSLASSIYYYIVEFSTHTNVRSFTPTMTLMKWRQK